MHTIRIFVYTIALQIYKKAVIYMRKFEIPTTPSSTNKCIRFPNNVIEQVEDAIKGTNCSFSAFVIEAVKVALENLNDKDN